MVVHEKALVRQLKEANGAAKEHIDHLAQMQWIE